MVDVDQVPDIANSATTHAVIVLVVPRTPNGHHSRSRFPQELAEDDPGDPCERQAKAGMSDFSCQWVSFPYSS